MKIGNFRELIDGCSLIELIYYRNCIDEEINKLE